MLEASSYQKPRISMLLDLSTPQAATHLTLITQKGFASFSFALDFVIWLNQTLRL